MDIAVVSLTCVAGRSCTPCSCGAGRLCLPWCGVVFLRARHGLDGMVLEVGIGHLHSRQLLGVDSCNENPLVDIGMVVRWQWGCKSEFKPRTSHAKLICNNFYLRKCESGGEVGQQAAGNERECGGPKKRD